MLRVLFRSIFSIVEGSLLTTDTLVYGAKIVIAGLVLLIVCIPEGLALAAQIAMALSIGKLKEDKILVKNHDAIQKAATITDICVSKSGVLTKGDGYVKQYHLAGQEQCFDNEVEGERFALMEELDNKQEVIDCILMNSDVTFQADDPKAKKYKRMKKKQVPEYFYRPKGPSIEMPPMNFLNGVS